MGTVNYNAELFDILKDLTSINNAVVLDKEEKKVVVRRADSESTIAYELTAPKEYFDFKDEQVAFYNYNEFYQYLKAFVNSPELSIDNKKVNMKDGSARTVYLMSNPEAIPPGPKSINFTDPDIRFKFKASDHDEFIRMINLIKPKKAQIFGKGDKITIKIFNNLHDNTFEKEFEVENLSNNADEEVDFVIFSDTFEQFPQKRDYQIEIKKQGFVRISLVDEKMTLDVYTGRIKS